MWLLCYRISASLLKHHPKNYPITNSLLGSNNAPLAQGEISLCVCFSKHVWEKPNTCLCVFSHTCLVISTLMCNKTHLCGESHADGPYVVCGFYHTCVGKIKHVWKYPHILTISKFHMGSSISKKSFHFILFSQTNVSLLDLEIAILVVVINKFRICQ